MFDEITGRIGNQTTYASTVTAEGKRLFGDTFVGTFARDTLPPVSSETRAYVVNTDQSTGPGVHFIAVLDSGGQRYLNDSLGHFGRKQRAELVRLQPHTYADDDAEQLPSQKDCAARSLTALAIGLTCGLECFLAL